MTAEQRKPTVDEMWAYIGKILIPMDQMPDRTSMNDKQIQEFYYNLTVADSAFKDLVQVAIFKNEIAAIENEQK